MKRWPVLVLLVALASTIPAHAQPRFFEGKTIRIVVGFSAGGGYDTYSRAIARHMSRHIPGNPTIIVENMTGAVRRPSAWSSTCSSSTPRSRPSSKASSDS